MQGPFSREGVYHRDPDRIEHTVEELVAQRVYALALGYEDLKDHDELRLDPMLAGKTDPKGEARREERDRGKALAGKSTLKRSPPTAPPSPAPAGASCISGISGRRRRPAVSEVSLPGSA